MKSFEAWKFGPVIPSIYQHFKLFGSSPIMESDFQLFKPRFIDLTVLDDHAKNVIDYTWSITKEISATQLSGWTHALKSPWEQVYNPKEWSTLIENERIQEYFKGFLKKPENA